MELIMMLGCFLTIVGLVLREDVGGVISNVKDALFRDAICDLH